MRVIGITGGVGAGKSRVLSFLREEFGAYVVEADKTGHQVMEPGTQVYDKIVELFGNEILNRDGTIDRGRLGGIVFHDSGKREQLNALVHPAVKARIREELACVREESGCSLFVIEAALLIEDHYEELCDEFWYIHTEEAVRRERLALTRGYPQEKITAILKSQQSASVFYAHCQKVIENSGSLEETYAQIRKLCGQDGTKEKERQGT